MRINLIWKSIAITLMNLIIYLISLMIKKTDKYFLVGGWFGYRFSDNSKHFYISLIQQSSSLGIKKVIWITRDKKILIEIRKMGYLAYSTWSILSIWYHLRSRYHVIDQSKQDINPFFSVRAKRLNLWHGFPLKKIGNYSNDETIIKKIKKVLKFLEIGCWSDYYLLATSELSKKVLGFAFGVPSRKIIISNYPRNYDYICQKERYKISTIEDIHYLRLQHLRSKGYKIIGYFPTFRDNTATIFLGTNNPTVIKNFLDSVYQSGYVIITKFHFAESSTNYKKDFLNHKALINLESEQDIYDFSKNLNLLITDYSSIYFDALLWNIPILFFPYDLDFYINKDRGLIFDYHEFTPGPKYYDLEALNKDLKKGYDYIYSSFFEKYSICRESILNKVYSLDDTKCIHHLVSELRII